MKLIQLLFIFIISAKIIFSQADVDIILNFDDGSGETRDRRLGLDTEATTGIDGALGEEALPPVPPGLEVRFELTPFGFPVQVYRDYRNAPSFPYTGIVEHRLAWSYNAGATGFTINYDLPAGATMLLTDAITGTIFTSGDLSGTGSFLVPNGTAFQTAKLFMNYDAVIPVELISFNASLDGSKINLKWQTASEVNNLGFDVERKIDSNNWNKIGFVQGSGTTTQSNNYFFVNNIDQPGRVYSYRLKQIDYDGSYKYSSEIKVDLVTPADFNLSQNFPNPFNPSTTISFSIPVKSSVKLLVYNQIGELVDEVLNSTLETGTYNYTWNAKNFSSGIYFYEIQTDNFRSIKKMTLIK